MFPNTPMGVARHHADSTAATPSVTAAAAAAAASHAYFHNHYAHYGHPAHNYGLYTATASDLNSNMYNGQNGPQFTNNEWAGPNATPTNATPTNWSAFGHAHTPTVSADLWPNNSADSPPNSENNLTSNNGGRSPGNYTQSHSSDSPSGTPTPGAVPNVAGNFEFQRGKNFNANFGGQAGQHSPSGGISNQCSNGVMEPHSPISNNLGGEGNLASPGSLASPNSRPQPARSPYEWMKKPSYQSQPEKSGKLFFMYFVYIM